jgi:hypothetical protein
MTRCNYPKIRLLDYVIVPINAGRRQGKKMPVGTIEGFEKFIPLPVGGIKKADTIY